MFSFNHGWNIWLQERQPSFWDFAYFYKIQREENDLFKLLLCIQQPPANHVWLELEALNIRKLGLYSEHTLSFYLLPQQQ